MRNVLLVALGVALGVTGSAVAATKTATLTGPSSIASQGRWASVCVMPQEVDGSPGVAAVITACAKDDAFPNIVDCKSATRATVSPPAAVTNLVNFMIGAWNADYGY
jgi:hypothetical protein